MPARKAPAEKAEQVREMFSAIAGRYDLLNHLLSLGIDRRWRHEAARAALEKAPKRVLDVATGTADLAILLKRLRPEAEVIGVDFAEPMLDIGRRKVRDQGLDVKLECADGLKLPYPEGSFDAVTIAYGLRNFIDFERGLYEFCRVLKPGGRLVVLDFPPPPDGPFGKLFRLYLFRVLPLLGGLISGRRSAYSYLPDSMLAFPTPDKLAAMMAEAGFAGVRYRLQSFGASAMHVADKPANAKQFTKTPQLEE